MHRVYKLLKRVPRGKVTTYGELGKAAKLHPRVVGMFMRKNPYAPAVPCHRVVASDGKLGGFSGKQSKAAMLRAEGIEIKKGKIDLKRYFYKF